MRFQARLVVVSAVAMIGTSSVRPMTATGSAPAGTPAAQVERGLLVTVLDKDNNPLRDLTAKDFLVFEDGVQREVTGAELTSAPMSISIMVDTTKSAPGVVEPTRDIRTSLLTFVQTVQAATPEAEVAITEFAGAGVLLRSFTSKPEELAKAITRIVPNQRVNAVLLEAMIDAAKDIRKRPGPAGSSSRSTVGQESRVVYNRRRSRMRCSVLARPSGRFPWRAQRAPWRPTATPCSTS